MNHVVSEKVILPSDSNSSSNNKKKSSLEAYLSCEILAAGVPALMDGLVFSHPELLTMLWSLLDLPPQSLSPRQIVGFCRINGMLLHKRTADLVHFIQSNHDIVGKWLQHIFADGGAGVPHLSDLLVALVQCDHSTEGAGIVSVRAQPFSLVSLS